MDKYLTKIKNKMLFEMIGAIALIPVGVYALIRYWNTDGVVSGTPVKDFAGGLFNGIRSGIVIGFIIYLLIASVKNLLATKNEAKLKKIYVEENDERAFAISERSSRVTFNITMYVLLAACVVTGIFNTAISLTLLAAWVFMVLIRLITLRVFDAKM